MGARRETSRNDFRKASSRFFIALLFFSCLPGASALADGFIYVYGVRNDLSKKLMAARVHPDQLTNFDAWRFWDGGGWSAQLDDAAPITDQISNELSVSPLADGRYALVFQVGGITAHVGVRLGEHAAV